MRASWVLVVAFLSACLQPGDIPCSDGRVCPATYTCTSMGCASPDQVKACVGLAEEADCSTTAGPGLCVGGGCYISVCGNGKLEPREVCDDGNTLSADGCNGTCRSDESCGNGIVELDEECDNADETKCAKNRCKNIRCGDGMVEGLEKCDDDNTDGNDGCSPDCLSLEVCGNDIEDFLAGEQCDDGNLRSFDGCNPQCLNEHRVWVASSPSQGSPVAELVTGAYDTARHRLVVFGGVTGSAQLTNDTWELDGSAWTLRAPTRSPSPRWAARMAYDSKRGRIVMFGGETNDGYENITWEYDGLTWHEKQTVARPAGRKEHVLVYDPVRDRIVMFGGFDGANLRDDTWEYDGSNWVETTAATKPSARWMTGATFDAVRGKIVLYGGTDATVTTGLNDTWEYNGAWSLAAVTAPSTGGRWAHTLTFDPTRGFPLLAGGKNINSTNLPETWVLAGAAWSQVGGAAAPPQGHIAAFDALRKRVVLWGGYVGSTPSQVLRELVGSTWQTVTPSSNTTQYTQFPSIAFDSARGSLMAFGGFSGQSHDVGNEMWAMGDVEWQRLNTAGGPPAARYRTAMAYDAVRNRLVVFGGQTNPESSGTTVLGDTWELNGTTWITPSPASSPPARAGHRMVYDTSRKKVVLFGGDNLTGAMNDLWEWDGTTWTQVTLASPPEPRTDFGMAFDSKRERIVIWGGDNPSGTPPPSDSWILTKTAWTRLTSMGPTFRLTPAMTYDSARDRVLLYGGGPGSPREDLWEFEGEHDTWSEIFRTPTDPPFPRSKEHAIAYDPVRARVIRLGAYTPGFPVYTYEVAETTEGVEICESGKDVDGDTKIGCADDDCWGMCTPQCPPGSTNASCPMLKRCGDGTCDPLESCRICPGDCPLGGSACPVLCGDGFCDTSETAVSCPGDC